MIPNLAQSSDNNEQEYLRHRQNKSNLILKKKPPLVLNQLQQSASQKSLPIAKNPKVIALSNSDSHKVLVNRLAQEK